MFFRFLILLTCSMLCYAQTCVGDKWDITSNVWYTDCTDYNSYDGLFSEGSNGYSTTASGDTIITLADNTTHRFYWRLYYFNNIVDPGSPVPDSIPLLAGVHCWELDESSLDYLFNSCLTYLSEEPAAERVISMSFSIDVSPTNANTWWWGSKVNNVPTAWAANEVVKLIKDRTHDACQLLANAGATELANKHVDENRIYIRGQSMGGTGSYHIGIPHPELFAAIFCNAGFADYKGNPCGVEGFCESFDNDQVGTASENLKTIGLDGIQYSARDYTDMSWFVGTHKGVSWETAYGNGRKYEPPYICMRHGTNDDAVNISSADRLHTVLEAGKWGYAFQRDNGGHSDNAGTRLGWMLNVRKNQSYLGFSNNSTNTTIEINFLDRIGWRPSSIVDQTNHYEVQLTGASGHTDVTLHRLQNFIVEPSKTFHYWIGSKSGTGTAVTASSAGFLTLASIAAGSKIIIEPDEPALAEDPERESDEISFTVEPNPFNPTTKIALRLGSGQAGSGQQVAGSKKIEIWIYNIHGKLVCRLPAAGYQLSAGITWDASLQPSGMYIVAVKAKSKNYYKSITLMK